MEQQLLSSSSPKVHSSDDKPQNLIKYKIETNLEEFNKNRPGISFDDDEEEERDVSRKNDEIHEFKDARFYTDHHFLKLANQLKERSLGGAFAQTSVVVSNNKPVNIVEPIRVSELEAATPMSPISSSLWKLQCEQYEDRMRYLENQIKGLYEHLEMQTQVNAELKKMLIASIGTDIQYKIERLVNDKQRFELELSSNSKRLSKLSDELEKVSIQCDLWRTKFIASKSMNDELAAWKTFLLLLQQENNHLLRNLLNDNELINQKLNNIYTNLVYLKEREPPKASCTAKNNLKLATSIDRLVSELLMNDEAAPQWQPCGDQNILNVTTKSEYLAKQMLIQFAWLPTSSCTSSVDLIESLLHGLKLQKTKLLQRYDHFNDDTVNLTCCSKCKGNVQIV